MAEQFEHPIAIGLLREIRRLFESKTIFRKPDRPIVFLCGGPVGSQESDTQSMRREFLAWAKDRLPELDIVLAEKAYKHTKIYEPLDLDNLADFEALIASVVDCVLMFPESAGSFAELGLFSGSTEVTKKILVANDMGFQGRGPFINLGPIRTIDRHSDLRPTIQIGKQDGRFDFEALDNRLRRFRARPTRKSFQYETYAKLEYLGKLLVVLEIISIVEFVTIESLYQCMRVVFDSADPKELRAVLSILTGAGYVGFENEVYFLNSGKDSLLEFQGFEMQNMKARVIFYYMNYRRDLYNQLRRQARNAG